MHTTSDILRDGFSAIAKHFCVLVWKAKDLNAPKEGLQLGIALKMPNEGVGIQKEFFGTVGKYL
jgi:hypothetical protein